MVETVVAQVGIGYWGPNILRNLVNSDQCSVKKVVEIDKPRQLWVKENYPDIEMMIQSTQSLFQHQLGSTMTRL